MLLFHNDHNELRYTFLAPLLLAEESREKSWLFRVILVALTALSLWNSSHDLLDMLSATGP